MSTSNESFGQTQIPQPSEHEVTDLRKMLVSLESNVEQLRMVMKLIDTYTCITYTDEHFNELKEICKVILGNVPFMLTVLDTTYITRARQNIKPIFSKTAEISYNNNLPSISQGRFNLAEESAFYGCLPTYHADGKLINYRNQCPLFEVCKELSNGQGISFPAFFTFGFWKIVKKLPVLNLCYEDDHLASNPAINGPVSQFVKDIKKEASGKTVDFILEVWRYFSGLTRRWDDKKNTNYYFILTAFYHAFKETYRRTHSSECAGIIYPSAMTEAKGLNIVLNPEGVDYHLQLSKVQMWILRSRGLRYDYEPITGVVTVIDGNFVFDKKLMFWYNLSMHNWSEINGYEG